MLPVSAEIMATVATCYGVGAATTTLFQARQMLKSGRSGEVSARFFGAYVTGYAIWLLYGLSIQSLPIMLADGIGLLCGTVTLGITLALRGSLLRPWTWNGCSA